MERVKLFITELYNGRPDFSCIEDNKLLYSKILTDIRIRNALIYNHIYKKILGVPCCKLTIKDTLNSLNDIVNNIVVNSVFKLVKVDLNGLIKQLEPVYSEYLRVLNDDSFTIKQEIYNYMVSRGIANGVYEHNKTLYSYFDTTKLFCSRDAYRNPFTGFNLMLNHLEPGEKLITKLDLYRNMFSTDLYFCRICNRTLVLGNSYDKEYISTIIKFYKPTLILSVVKNDPYAHYIIDEAYIHDIQLLITCKPSIVQCNIIFWNDAHAYGMNPLVIPEELLDARLNVRNELISEYFNIFFKNVMNEPSNKIYSVTLPLMKEFVKLCNNNSNQRELTSGKNCMLLVDNRKNIHSAISCMIGYSKVNKSEWDLVVCTDPDNRSYYLDILGDVNFVTHDRITISKYRDFNIEDYNVIMKDVNFWKQLENYEYCLVIQDDGVLCAEGIERFLKYDYIGPPWIINKEALKEQGCKQMVGNGGFSLRKVSKMIEVCEDDTRQNYYMHNMMPVPEDVFFSSSDKLSIPSVEIASEFGMEQIYNIKALGFHKPWPYIGVEKVIEYLKYHKIGYHD
jgi:hypothetical protein